MKSCLNLVFAFVYFVTVQSNPERRIMPKSKNATRVPDIIVFHDLNRDIDSWNNSEFTAAFRRKKKTTLPPMQETECEFPPTSEVDMRAHLSTRRKRLTTSDGLACLEDYPYTVSVRISGKHWCGGALVGIQWVLSSGLCFDGVSLREVTIRLGSVFRDYGGYLYSVVLLKKHPEYHKNTLDHNLAMIKLHAPVRQSIRIRPVGLPTPFSEIYDYPYIGEIVVSGFGSTGAEHIREGENQELRRMTVSDVSDRECKMIYEEEYAVQRDHLCLNSVSQGVVLCTGDIGNPAVLFTNSNKEGTLLGIALYSGSEECARKKKPGIYTKVSHSTVWIESVMKGIEPVKKKKTNLIVSEPRGPMKPLVVLT